MDSSRFDHLARALGALRTRRATTGFVAGLIASALLSLQETEAKPKRRRKQPQKQQRSKKCKNGTVKCGRKCRNVQRDDKNCGACGTRCSRSENCKAGLCVAVSCPSEQCCDNQSCNGDGRCRDGTCQPRPNCLSAGEYLPFFGETPCCSGDADCWVNEQSGLVCICEAGAPLTRCLRNSDCRQGSCVGYQCTPCPNETTQCNGECMTFHSDAHCGACGNACAPSEFCQNQTCQPRYVEDKFIAAPDVYDIAVDATGTIFATREDDHCVRQYSQSGTVEHTYGVCGTYGSDNGHLDFPDAVAAYGNRVFIADEENDRIQIFRRGGNWIKQLAGGPGSGPNQVRAARGLAVDADRNMYVADTGNNRILMFDRNDALVRTIGTGVQGSGSNQFNTPIKIACDRAGNLYVADYNNNRLQKFDNRTGSYVRTYGSTGLGNVAFTRPADIAITSTGDLFVKDNGRIQQVNAYGVVIRVFTTPASSLSAVAVDAQDNLYMADHNRGGIVRFKLNAPKSS